MQRDNSQINHHIHRADAARRRREWLDTDFGSGAIAAGVLILAASLVLAWIA